MKFFNRLKMLLSLALVLCMATQMQAADVDLAAAKNVAKSFMAKQVKAGRLKAVDASNLKLVKAEASVFNPKAVDYYIFNANKSYVVVAGDDQAPEVLMYGVSSNLDLDKVPPAMKWLLNKYKYQIDGLKAGTLKANNYSPKATTAVAPLVTCTWDQTAPYYNHTPTSGGTHAYTGCPATSLSMCFYLYKWPKTYPALEAIPANNYYGYLAATALEEKAADWDNILEHYGTWYDDNGSSHSASYNSTQAEAISWLMRYVGQACNMGYSTSGSGATDPEILEACHTFGYTDAQLLTLNELVQSGWSGYTNGPAQYTDAQWNEWMLAELHAGRPIEYLAYDCSDSSQPAGHAFNVFGCDANGKYYVNWGWSGDSNGYCTLHNFTTATGATGQSGSYVFNYGEAMIIGIAPPAGALGPQILVNPTSLEFEGYVGDTYTKTFTVTGANLEGDITISKQGSNNITVSPTTITAANAANGVEVTVTYKPTNVGTASAALTLSSDGADDVTLNVTGTAQAKIPTINVDPASLSFNANLSNTVTKTVNVTGLFLTNNVTVTLNDNNGVFSVTPTTITAANAANGVPVTVSFSSENEGTFTGSLTIASTGAESKTVALSATARDGGTASDAYLNIAKYATIDEAGNQVSGMNTIYKYTEYNDEDCAWLTVSNYGANMDDANQNWFSVEATKNEARSWDADDVFLGSSSYFGNNTSYCANWVEAYQHFYVTNCSQIKQYAYNRGSSYPLKIYIYECTDNGDGTITAATTPVQTLQSQTYSTTEVLQSTALDPSKIYKISVYNDYSFLYEIGFKTPIEGVETPVATAATEVGTNEFTANWNACEGATSYTLRVTPKPETTGPELLISENFSAFSNAEGSTDLGSSLDSYMQNAGWTGSYVFERAGGLQIGSNSSAGRLVSPQLDLTGSNGKVTVKFNAYSYSSSYSPSTLYVSMNGETANQQSVSVAYGTTGAEYTVVLDCNAVTGQTVSFRTSARRYRVVLTNVEIYSGDITEGAKAAGEMLFPGITDTHYTVTGLEPATTYIYDVKAVYGEKESNWSNQIEVTTLEAQETGTPLAEILTSGVNGTEYLVSDDLAVVDIAEYKDYAFLTDGNGNWIRIECADSELFSTFVNSSAIKGNTLRGTLSNIELNPVLTVTEAESGDVVPTFSVQLYYLNSSFNPKVNEVIDVVGWWNANDGALRAYAPGSVQGASMTLDISWGASSNTLQNGQRYQVRCAMNIKEAWHTPAGIMPKDYDYDFQNYIGYALRLPDTPTAIGTVGLDGYNETVNVYNAQGQLIRSNVKASEATRNLPRGIYIVGNNKVVVK